jgi:hypothetical protein
VGFPLARLAHETLTPVLLGGNPTPPDDVVTFLAFQALVSMGFAIGFIWLYERITPAWADHHVAEFAAVPGRTSVQLAVYH